MIRRLSFLFAVGLILLPAALAAPALAETKRVQVRQADVSEFPVVSLTVSVEGAAQPTSGEIRVTENGASVRNLVVRALSAVAQGIDVVLAIDTSGSMKGAPLDSAVAAAKEFLRNAPQNVAVGVVTFSDRSTVVQPITTDHAAALTALDSLNAAGETSLFDAVVTASRLFSGPRQHNIILLTDGGDTRSKASLQRAVSAANLQGAAVFSIGLTSPETDIGSLRALSSGTGGRYVAASQANLTSVYQQILTTLSQQYLITYRSTAAEGSRLDITVSVPQGSGSLVVRAPGTPVAPSVSRPAPQPPPAPGKSFALFHGFLGMVLALGLAFLAAFLLVFMLLEPGTQAYRERDLAKRMAAPPPETVDRGERSIATILPTLVAMGDRLANAGGFTLTLERKLERAGLPLTPGEVVAGSAAAAVIVAILGGVIFQSPLFGLIFAVIGALIPSVVLSIAERRRTNKLHQQLPDVLMILASSLRAGHSFLQAIDTVSKEAAEPAAKEFTRVVTEIRLGRPMEEAMNAMAERVGSDDFKWAILAVNIQRQVGGNLAEVLDIVAETVRDRDAIRRQVDVLATEGKLSTYILMGLPIVVGLWILKFNPDYIGLLFHTTGGLIMFFGAIGLMVVGYIWMRKIVNVDV